MEEILRERLEELAKERAEYDRKKSEALGRISSLNQQLTQNEILIDDYADEVSKLKDSISKYESTISYHNSSITDVEKQLEEQEKAARRSKTRKEASVIAISALIVLLTLGIFLSQGIITGLLITEEVTTYAQDINITATETITYLWQPENAGELRSVAVSGRLTGKGTAKVYLEKGNARYLILDNAALGSKAITSITGFAILENITTENTTTAANVTETIVTNTTVVENITTIENMPENITIPAEETAAAEKTISISLEYNEGTPFDSDNDGIEFNTSAIDFTVEETNFSWGANSNLCTQWIIQPEDRGTATSICYGSGECCALLGIAPESSSWNDALAISLGLYGTETNNTVSSRVIYANYSLEGEIYSDIRYSNFSSLPATFVPEAEEEAAENITNVTVTEFSKICEETCTLAGMNDSSYNLIIEVANATLEISSITYTITTAEEIDSKPPIVTIVSPQITVYNTTAVELNYSADEPVSSAWYVLNSGSGVAIYANTTITAINGTNTLTLYATDLAGNTGSDEVIFSVRLPEIAEAANATNITAPTNVTLNITPQLKAVKKHYKPDEDAEFEFEFIEKAELVRAERWKDDYEEYEEDYEEYLEKVSAAKKAAIEKAVTGKDGIERKQSKQWTTENETILAEIFDSAGSKAEIDVEIGELREGKFSIKMPKQRAFRAGKYTLQLKLIKDNITYTEEQDFTWGVLAINTNKSIYLPNEEAFIAMAVLDDQGHMVCDADVTLTITEPSSSATTLTTENREISISDECEVYGVTNLPDYYTNYTVSRAGAYLINLTAITRNGVRSIQDSFTVQDSVAFDVARTGPTRIYPPVPYAMNFTITANEDYKGSVTEYVPASFEIIPQPGFTITAANDTKTLTWSVDLASGETYNLAYEFNAPDISPYLYTLGKLEIGSFAEARQWQAASDAATVVLINADAEPTATGTAETATYTGGKNIVRLDSGTLVAFWEDDADDPSCSDSTDNGTTWSAYSSETATHMDTAIATNGSAIVYITQESANDIDYVYRTTGVCDVASGTFADITSSATFSNDHWRPDVAYDGVNNRFVTCQIDDDDGDVDFTYTSVGATLSWTGVGAVSGATTTDSCSIDVDEQGIVYIAADDSASSNIRVYNSTDLFTTTTTTVAYGSAVTDLHISIRGAEILITAVDTATARLVIVYSSDGVTYANATYSAGGTVNDAEGCIDQNNNYHSVFTNEIGLNYVRYSQGSFDNNQLLTGAVAERYPSVLCTNFPASNRLPDDRLDVVFTDTLTNIYYANVSVDTSTPDTTPPNNSIVLPAADTNISGSFTVNASVNDSESDVTAVNLSLLQPESVEANSPIALNLSVGSLQSGYFTATIDTVTLNIADGIYNLSVNATDSATTPNTNISENVTVTIDNTPPNVSIDVPVSGTAFADESFLINASVNDTTSQTLNATFRLETATGTTTDWLDTTLGAGDIQAGWWNATVDSTTLTNGDYNITINATDYAGNQNVTNITTITINNAIPDTTPPNNSIVIPTADTNISGTFIVNASVNDSESDVTAVNLSLLQPGSTETNSPIALNLSVGSLQSGYFTATIDTVTLSIADGIYNLSVNATDSAATPNTNISENVSVTIDNTPANVSIDAPASGAIQNGSILINASVNDTTSKVFNATFRLTTATGSTVTDWLDAALGAEDIQVGFWDVTFDTTTVADDVYNVTINATDFAGNQNITNISTIEIDNIPNASIVLPEADTNVSGSFLINVSANSSNLNIDFVNLTILNSTGNATDLIPMSLGAETTTSGYWNATFSSTTLVDGFYNLSINVTTQGTSTEITANVSITIDNTDANLTLVSPINLTNFTDANILINASVNDTLSKVFNVSFQLYNSTGNATEWLDATLDSGDFDQGYWSKTVSSTTLVNGYYNITVNATDYAGNQLIENLSSINVSNAEAGAAPIVYNVTAASVTPVAASHATNVAIRFNVTDADGVGDASSGLSDTTAKVNITFLPGETAEYSRFNDTGNCAVVESSFNDGQDRSYECIVAVRFHDNASLLWRINASVEDLESSTAYNSSQNLTINSLSAIELVSANLALSSPLGTNNNELTLVLNNTGNFEFTLLNLTPRVLNASITDFFMLGGETSGVRGSANFSFNTSASTGSGFGVGLENNTWINISDNYEFTNNEGLSITLPSAPGQTETDIDKANRTFYIYIDLPSVLTSDVTYNSSLSPDHRWIILAE